MGHYTSHRETGIITSMNVEAPTTPGVTAISSETISGSIIVSYSYCLKCQAFYKLKFNALLDAFLSIVTYHDVDIGLDW